MRFAPAMHALTGPGRYGLIGPEVVIAGELVRRASDGVQVRFMGLDAENRPILHRGSFLKTRRCPVDTRRDRHVSMRIVVFGGRDYLDQIAVVRALTRAHSKHPGFTLAHGDCPTGADHWADLWCRAGGNIPEAYTADWATHGRAAGPIRNQEMSDKADAGIGFPGGRGTADMARRLAARDVPVWWPQGRA